MGILKHDVVKSWDYLELQFKQQMPDKSLRAEEKNLTKKKKVFLNDSCIQMLGVVSLFCRKPQSSLRGIFALPKHARRISEENCWP